MKRLLIFLLAVSLAQCGSRRDSDTLTIATPGTVNSMDPYSENSAIAFSVHSNIYEPLVMRDSNLRITPVLATEWRTPDDLTWIITLRNGVTFHDGSPLTALDVRASLERARNEKLSQISSALWMINRVEVLPGNEVRITTTKRYSTLLNRLAEVLIVPQNYAQNESTRPPAGTGPYRLVEWKAGSFVRLEANTGYWGAAPTVHGAMFVAVPDLNRRVTGLKDGTYDILPHLEPEVTHDTTVTRNEDLRMISPQGLGVIYLGMDLEREASPYVTPPSNPFRDVRVRQAIYCGVNIRNIVDNILEGFAEPATQMVAPLVFGFHHELRRPPYDPDRARALLREAGYEKGFSVRLDCSKDRYRNDEEIGRAVASDLEKIGIRVEVNAMHRQDLFRTLNARDSSFYMVGWFLTSGDSSGAYDYLIHSRDEARGYGRENVGGFSDPKIDQMIEGASGIMKPSDRAVALQELMKTTMEQLPYIPLHIENNFCAYSAKIDWQPRSDEYIYIKDIRWKQ